ncbi:unnamed protein product [Gadus morhua 'NCC']
MRWTVERGVSNTLWRPPLDVPLTGETPGSLLWQPIQRFSPDFLLQHSHSQGLTGYRLELPKRHPSVRWAHHSQEDPLGLGATS